MDTDVVRLNIDELWDEARATIPGHQANSRHNNHFYSIRDKITEHAVEAKKLILFGVGKFESARPNYIQKHSTWYGWRFHYVTVSSDRFTVDPNKDRNFYWAMTMLNEHEMELSRRKKPTAKPTILEAKVITQSAFIVDCKIRMQGSSDPQSVPDLILRLGIAAPSRTHNKGICKTSVICNLDDKMALVGRAGKNKGKSLREMIGFPVLNEQEMVQQVIGTIADLGKE